MGRPFCLNDHGERRFFVGGNVASCSATTDGGPSSKVTLQAVRSRRRKERFGPSRVNGHDKGMFFINEVVITIPAMWLSSFPLEEERIVDADRVRPNYSFCFAFCSCSAGSVEF